MMPVENLIAAAQFELKLDPFSVWVYEIHDGVEVWRPAGFTPAEWEAHLEKTLLPAVADEFTSHLQNFIEGLFGDVFKDIAPMLNNITEMFAGFGLSMQSLKEFADLLGVEVDL